MTHLDPWLPFFHCRSVDLTCSADSVTPDGSCLIVYDVGLAGEASFDWTDSDGFSLTPRTPGRVGMWKADCRLTKVSLQEAICKALTVHTHI